ncbi:MAG: thioredoxin family protein [Thermonemataceae bacterium]|nr:thioredoxin family protein [Thermonemataceae bacterium]
MKRKLILTILGLGISVSLLFAQINFEHGTWAEVKAKAKSEKKAIFVDAFTTWCGPCKWMAANTFTDTEVGKFYNANFINYKFDMEKGEGTTFAQTYSVNAYPTLLFFDANGEIVHKMMGAAPAEPFLAWGKDALNPETQFFTLQRKYKSGERKPQFLRNYVKALTGAGEDPTKVAVEYIQSQDKKNWSNTENWAFIQENVNDLHGEIFVHILKNKADFEAKVGAESLNKFVEKNLMKEVMKVAESNDVAQLDALKADFKKIAPQQADKYIARAEFIFYSRDEAKSFEYIAKYFDNYADDWQELNEVAWYFFQNSDEPTKLQKATNWAKKSVEIDKNFANTDTYANLLYKIGNKKDALKWAEESVALGQKSGENTQATEDLIKRIQEDNK